MTNIVLASKSPRRRELFKEICSSFLVDTADIDEDLSKGLEPLECVLDLSKRKGNAIKDKYPEELIISCDTIVVLNNHIIGKPKDYEDAVSILKEESGQTHEVITGYTFIYKDHYFTSHTHSYVKFNKLDDELIKRYLEDKKPFDKAGAYGIQDSTKEYPIIESFTGSYSNIMGFPLKEIRDDLIKFCNDFNIKTVMNSK